MPLYTQGTVDATTTVKGKVKLAGDLDGTADLPTIKTDVALAGNPTTTTQGSSDNSTKIATTAFVTSSVAAAAAGFQNKGASRLATAAALPANVYNNGASGLGATLTAVALGALTVDGVAVALNDRIIVKDEATPANNGIYTVTVLGTAGVLYVLTRATNMDTTLEIGQAYSFVTAGTANNNTSWNVNAGTYTVGTTAIVWNQFSAAPSLTGGDGITVVGSLIGADYDSSTIDINGSNQLYVPTGGITGTELEDVVAGDTVGSASAIPVITYDDNGRITSTTTAAITGGTQRTFAYWAG